MPSLAEQISTGIKEAMRAKDSGRLAALRDIKSKLMLEATKEGAGEVDDVTTIRILSKLLKQRKETAQLYREQNRPDLAVEEESQAEVIEAYLPQQLSEDEIRTKVESIIQQTGASSMADMGKVMGMASQQLAGVADGKVISSIVRSILAN